MAKVRAIGPRLKTSYSRRLSMLIKAKAGKRLLSLFQTEVMFSACTDGRKFFTLTWLRALGAVTKTWSFSNVSMNRVRRNGQKLLTGCRDVSVSNAGSDGTIIWIHGSRRAPGLKKRNLSYTYWIATWKTSGPKLRNISNIVPITRLRTIGNRQWKIRKTKLLRLRWRRNF